MLSPGEFWKQVPKDPQENRRYREEFLSRAWRDRGLQSSVIAACRQDILFYTNLFVWTYDPRRVRKTIPFTTWAVQDESLLSILSWVEEGEDGVIEKSRDMGASWMCLLVMEWCWHFHPGMSFLMVSRKEDLVDAPGDPDSLFWKIDFIHRHLPGWLLPGGVDRRRLHFGNIQNGSTIDGESTTAAAGVGGRRTAMFIDEFSRIEEGYALLAGTADTTRCRIFNFTPWGANNAAYELASRHDLHKLRLHWRDHPEKGAGRYRSVNNKVEILDTSYVFPEGYEFILDGEERSPAYDREDRRRANRREMAQMWDIDYQGSSYQFFDRFTINTLIATYAAPPYWEGDLEFDEQTGRFLSLVRCEGGPLKLWCHLPRDGKPPLGRYAIGGDLSAGSGATNSCLIVLDMKTGEQVGEYVSPFLRPEQMAPRAVALAWCFRQESDAQGNPGDGAYLGWEVPGPGLTFGQRVLEMGYRHIFFRTADNRVERKVSDVAGWHSQTDTKRSLLEEFRAGLSTRQCVLRSRLALEETMFFIHTKEGAVEHSQATGTKDPSGARANHGDRVIGAGIAWKLARPHVMRKKEEEVQPDAVVGTLAWRRRLAEEKDREGWR